MSKINDITPEFFKNIIYYNPATGIITWVNRPRYKKKNGTNAGIKRCNGKGKMYMSVTIHGVRYYNHRLAWFITHGKWPNQIDHINGNGLDNRIENLRDVDSTGNHRNMRKPCTNTSGYVGVSWHKKASKWVAEIWVNKKKKHLGLFDSIEEAANTRKQAEKKYGFHCNHGTDRPL